MNETKAIFLFGRLLLDMGEFEKARNYFGLLLETTPKDDHLDIATVHSYLGRVEREDGFLNKALSHHHKALQVRSLIYSD